LFRDEFDRVAFLVELANAGSKARWSCLGYCLMETHQHLLLEVEDGALPAGMHALNFRYAIGFNRRYATKGHVHGARYGARRLEGPDDLVSTFRYIARNPVEAMLCSAPAAWPWSSYAQTIGLCQTVSFLDVNRLLTCYDGPRELAIGALRAFVEES
jgi:putative transposase